MSDSSRIRWGWLRFMYLATFIVAGGSGLGVLLFPKTIQALFSWPVNDPLLFGMYGSVLLAYGSIALLGLRAPLKFVPLLLFQLVYKSLWMAGVILPLVLKGNYPAIATTIYIIFIAAIIGDLIAIPFPYLLRRTAQGEV